VTYPQGDNNASPHPSTYTSTTPAPSSTPMIDAYSRYAIAVFVETSVTTAVRIVKQMVNTWGVLASGQNFFDLIEVLKRCYWPMHNYSSNSSKILTPLLIAALDTVHPSRIPRRPAPPPPAAAPLPFHSAPGAPTDTSLCVSSTTMPSVPGGVTARCRQTSSLKESF
jgi:hypothetical protein